MDNAPAVGSDGVEDGKTTSEFALARLAGIIATVLVVAINPALVKFAGPDAAIPPAVMTALVLGLLGLAGAYVGGRSWRKAAASKGAPKPADVVSIDTPKPAAPSGPGVVAGALALLLVLPGVALADPAAGTHSAIARQFGVADQGIGSSALVGLVRLYGDGHVDSPSAYEGVSWKFGVGREAYPAEVGLYVGQSFSVAAGVPTTGNLSVAIHATFLSVFGIGAGADVYAVGRGFQRVTGRTGFIFVSANPTN